MQKVPPALQSKSINTIEILPKRNGVKSKTGTDRPSIATESTRSRCKDQTEFDKLNDDFKVQNNVLVQAKNEYQEIVRTFRSEVYNLEIERVQLVGTLEEINTQLENNQEKVCNAFFSMHNDTLVQSNPDDPDGADDIITSHQNEIRKLKLEYNQAAQRLQETETCLERKKMELNEVQQDSHEVRRKCIDTQSTRDSTYRKMIAPLLREAGHIGKKQFLFASQGELRKKFRVTDEATINRMSKDNLRTQFIIPLVAGGHPGAREVSQRGHKHGVKELRKSLLDLFGLNDGDK